MGVHPHAVEGDDLRARLPPLQVMHLVPIDGYKPLPISRAFGHQNPPIEGDPLRLLIFFSRGDDLDEGVKTILISV